MEEMHAQFMVLGKALAPLYPLPPDTITTQEGSYKGTRYRIYTPRTATEDKKENFPVGVCFHSGGFVLANLDSDDLFCREITANANVVIVNVEYRVAPKRQPSLRTH